MQFEITPAAREYINKKGGGVITVKLEKRQTGCNCCGATEVESPSVRLGVPKKAEIEQYQGRTSIDITIYVHSSLQSASISPKVDVERTLFGHKLALYGLPQD